MATVYGLAQTRITLYQADGVTPLYRIVLQKEDKEGLKLSYKPEGVSHQLGSGANWARKWAHRGFRPQLDIAWSHGLDSTKQGWTGVAWGAASTIITPEAMGLIFTWAFQSPCLVEPHLDKAYSFSAQPDPGKPFDLKDIKGVFHTGLSLSLIGSTVGSIPDWSTL